MTMQFLESDLPEVSIVIPVYNDELTIEQTILGLLDQDYPRKLFEIICVDNCSTDGSAQVLGSYVRHLRVLSAKTKGASAARNTGIHAANFDWIAFIDADCIPEKNWLKALISYALENSRTDFIGGPIIANTTNHPAERFSESIYDQKNAIELYKPPYVISANMLIRKSTLFKYGLFDESFIRGQDVELSFRGYFHFDATFGYAEKAKVRHLNPKSLSQIWHKGWLHGKASFAILSGYAKELGQTPWDRCKSRRRNLELMHGLLNVFKSAMCLMLSGAGKSNSENLMTASYDLAFKTAKQSGLMVEVFRHAIVSVYRNLAS